HWWPMRPQVSRSDFPRASFLLAFLGAAPLALAEPRAFGPLPADKREIFLGTPPDKMPEQLNHEQHYLASNEYRQDFFRPVITNLGGGYVGVGSDQSLLLLP